MTLPERLSLRFAREDDIPLVLRLIRELADYEHMLDEVVATEELLREWMFERRTVEALLAELDGEPVGFALFFHNFQDNVIVERIFKGIRPAVVALIAAPTFSMAKSARISRYNIWIPVVSALLIWLLGFSPIWIIIIAGVGGFLWGKLKKSD